MHSFLECPFLLILLVKVKANILLKVLIHTTLIIISPCIATRLRLCRFSNDTKQEFGALIINQEKAVFPVMKTDGQKEDEGMRCFNDISLMLQPLLHSVLIFCF